MERDGKWKCRSTASISSKEVTVGRLIRHDANLPAQGKKGSRVPNTSAQMLTRNVKARQMVESDRDWSRSIALKAPFQAQPCSQGLCRLQQRAAIHCSGLTSVSQKMLKFSSPVPGSLTELERVFAGVEMRSLHSPASNRTDVRRGNLNTDTQSPYRETPCEDWNNRETKERQSLPGNHQKSGEGPRSMSPLQPLKEPALPRVWTLGPQNWGTVNLC